MKREGFSLVEVIIAVTMLAIIAVPIVAYFTNAAVFTAKGKNTQSAGAVAQSVMEELNSCESFEQIEDKLKVATGSAWQVDTKADIPTSTSKDASVLSKDVTLDGSTYKTKVTVDYDYTGDTPEQPKYNDYQVPQLKEVYADTNVVLEETDQEDMALSHFLYRHKEMTKSTIRGMLSRMLCMDLTKDSTDPANPIYQIRGYYQYRMQGDSDVYEAEVKGTKIEVSKLNNIYVLYQLLKKDTPEEIKLTYNGVSQEEAGKINVYYIYQKQTENPTSTYCLTVRADSSGEFAKSRYYSNGVPINGAVTGVTDFVTVKNAKRIAKITVEVYDPVDTTKVLATMQTSKGA